MEWLDTLWSALGGSLITLIGGIVYLKPRLKTAKADASKAETEAHDARNDYLIKRIESMEKLYQDQGAILDSMRTKFLEMEKELHERDQRIVQLENENNTLRAKLENNEKENQALSDKVAKLEQEISSFRKRK